MKRTKLLFSLLVAIILLVAIAAMTQASASTVASGSLGDSVNWVLDSSGTLTISGSGNMRSYAYAFMGSTRIKDVKKVVIENGVTSIASSAFNECSNLTMITIPNSIKSIGESAFRECSKLESTSIPNGITSIERLTFYKCSSLKSVSLPTSLVQIGDYAFQNCSSLENISIPSNVSSIGISAFENCENLSSVSIPNSVKSTKHSVFSGCSNLKSVNIGLGLANIEFATFAYCYNLVSLNIPNTVLTIGSDAFYRCRSLTSLVIPNSVTFIGSSAFQDCSSLVDLTMPISAETDSNAFLNCESIKNLRFTPGTDGIMRVTLSSGTYRPVKKMILEDGIKTISNQAFWYCDSLNDLTIGEGIVSISSQAFSGCECLTFVKIPNSVVTIEEYAFHSCDNLAEVVLGKNVKTIEKSAFSYCSKLSSINLGNSLTTISERAFEECSSLTSISFPNSVSDIGVSAFENCGNLTSLIIPDGLSVISESTFESCENLTNIIIGKNVTKISGDAFSHCYELKTITVPKSVKQIEEYAFLYCSQLQDVYYTGTQVQWNQIVIDSGNTCLTKATIHYAPSDPTTPHTHIYGNYISDGNATCQADGTKTATCIYCSVTQTVADPGSKTDHRDTNNDGKCDFCGTAMSSGGSVNYDTCPDGLYQGTLESVHWYFPPAGVTEITYIDAITVSGKTLPPKDKTVLPFLNDGDIGKTVQIQVKDNKIITFMLLIDDPELPENEEHFRTGYDFMKDSYELTNPSNAIIDKSIYKTAFGDVTGKAVYDFYEKGKGGHGLCYGMANTTAALIMYPSVLNKWKVVDLPGTQEELKKQYPLNCIRDIVLGSHYLSDFNLLSYDYIKYGYVYQFDKNTIASEKLTTNNMQGLVNAVKQYIAGKGGPVQINFALKGLLGTRNTKHAVLAVGYLEAKDTYHILLDDSNLRSELTTMVINKDFSGWSYTRADMTLSEGKAYSWTSSNGEFTYNTNCANAAYNIGKSIRNGETGFMSSDSLLISASEIVTLEVEGIKLLTPIGTTDNQTSTQSEKSNLYWIAKTNKAQKITSTSNNNAILVSDGDKGFQIQLGKDQTATFFVDDTKESYVICPSGTNSIEYLKSNDKEEIESVVLTGEAINDNIRVSETSAGLQVSGLKDMVVTVAVDDKPIIKATTDSDGSSVVISVDESNKTISIAKDNSCPYCGKVHKGFFQKIVAFFHKILYKIFGAKKKSK